MKKSHESPNDYPKEEVRSAIRSGINQAEEQMGTLNIKKSSIKRKLVYTLVSVAAIFLLLVGSSHYSPTLASSLSQIPIIGSVFGNSEFISLQQAQKEGLTKEVGETQTVDGISVTLDEILYDQNNISIGLVIESDKDLGEYYFGAGMDFTMDGNRPLAGSGTFGEDVLSDTTRTAIQEINVTDEMPDEFDLGLVLQGENGEAFHFSIPLEKITELTTIDINHEQSVDGVNLQVKDMSISQTGLSLSYESSEAETDFDLSRGGNIEFKMEDQDGKEITGHSGGVTGELIKDKIIFKSNKQFDPINTDVKELTITPYVVIPSDGGGVELDEDGQEKELEYKGHLIKPVEFDSFTVDVR